MLLLSIFSFFFVANARAENLPTGIVNVSKDPSRTSNAMAAVLCNVMRFVTGGIGKTIASFIIIGVGVGFFTGKVSWGVLIGVTLGISAMFGAPAIIGAMTGSASNLCN